MRTRLRVLMTEAVHLVAIAVGAIAALVAYEAGKRGGHEVITVVLAVGGLGALGVGIATLLDPMGYVSNLPRTSSDRLLQASLSDPESLRIDDVLYASGVVLIGAAVLLAFVCTWAGVPPVDPFR